MPPVPSLDEQFNLRRRHPLGRLHLLKNEFESRAARRTLRCELNVPYADTAGQRLDLFPASRPEAPVFVFVHGGYFRALDKRQYAYIARQLVPRGFTVALVNYDLAPRVRVGEIVRQVIAAFAWIREHCHEHHGSAEHITLCGHSVGAFLAARVLEHDWPGGSGIRRAALLSGLYDLEPMRRSYLNADLHLEERDPADLNPRPSALRPGPDVLVAVGERETGEFVRQSREYSQRLHEAGRANQLMVLPRIHHYTMSRQLARLDSPVMKWMLDGSTAVEPPTTGPAAPASPWTCTD